MRHHNSRVQLKVTVLLVSLIALWGFSAWVTSREGLNLLGVSTLNTAVAQPSERLRAELQNERRLTVQLLADPSSGRRRAAVRAQWAKSEATAAEFLRTATANDTRRAAGDALNTRVTEASQKLRKLPLLRKQVDAGQVNRIGASATITDVIDSLYRVYDSMATVDDTTLAKETRTFIQMGRARELLAQEDVLATGALATGGFSRSEVTQFTQIVGAQRFLLTSTAAELPPTDRAAFERLARGDRFLNLRHMEDQLTAGFQPESLPVDAESWASATGAILSDLDKVIRDGGDALVERATPLAIGVVVRLILAGGLGLLAVIASIVLSITTARALVRRLEELRAAALELAAQRLPSVVERLGRGDDVDVKAEAPPLAVGNDAIGQVGQALNIVQETAIRVAVEQAELRRGYRGILLSLARRTQSLVHRQLTILDAMEKRETEPGELADLFRVDHLATRMRRNAENLIVLSGASPGRAWRRSVPMVDVVRGALAEVEDYTQVTLMPMGEAQLAGRAIGDVIHLLAELIENAVSFSPPYALVQVSGQEVARGYVVEIEDRGLGMPPDELAAANERIADPPEFKLSGTPRLGLYVVSRLASRHRIQVTLKASPYGGTTVVVLIPRDLIESDSDIEPAPEPDALPKRVSRNRVPEARQGEHSPTGEVPVQAADDSEEARPPLLTVAPRWEEASVPEQPSYPPAAPGDPGHTPSGLPRRVAQAHLAPALRDQPPAPPSAPAEDDELSPEELRRLMGSFQSGTERGRADAARQPRHLDAAQAWEDEPPTPAP
ncbi:nitrate- and nitrite sensing domain-containing protein [Sphaerisporangium dianthi]|uniref:histidine kinase n=1 Tax=Sphaerisporangium dianthi TaxID=1436120 RepID=A0ABV9CGS1_9ACTN